MKSFRGFVITLGVMFAMITFFPGIYAFADGSHDDPQTTASEAASASDEPTMKSFVLHAKRHMDEAVAGGRAELSAFNRQMRTQETWNSDSVYLITISKSGGTIINHGIYTKDLFGNSIAGLETVRELLAKLEQVAPGEAACVQYGDMDRWSCAVQYDSINRELKGILIGGFNHAKDDPAITPPDCPDYEPAVTAQQVNESGADEDLRDFVKEAIKRIDGLLKLEQTPQGTQGLQDALNKASCLGRGHWKEGSIYLFIMAKIGNRAPFVILNGNNPEFTGSPFENILDEDEVDIGAEILKVAGEHGESGFVKYKWDNPTIEEDDVDMEGRSPGRSLKTSYVEAVTFDHRPRTVFIFGSGTYEPFEPDGAGDMDSDGDDGCAIAGTDSKPWSAVFNLFLVVFSICIAFWWRDRSKK